jgi:excinuclease ABC subunit B
MQRAISETERRRAKQLHHNEVNGITAKGVFKQVRDLIDGVYSEKSGKDAQLAQNAAMVENMSEKELAKEIKRLEKQMMDHARNLEFESAARTRDQLSKLREKAFGASGHDSVQVA